MAQQKKGFFYRLTMGRDDQPDFDVSKLPGTRWAVFKDVIKNRFGAIMKINLLCVLFCLPAIAWMVWSVLSGIVADAGINYTGNFGFGLGANNTAELMGNTLNLQMVMMRWLVFIPCLMIASIGFAGAFHTLKLLVWGEGIAVASTFFKGIKSNIVTFLWSSLVVGIVIWLVMFNFASLRVVDGNSFLHIMSTVASVILFVLIIFMAMFMWTQSVTYKLKFWGLLKNSFLLAIGMILQNIFFVGITAIPVVIVMFVPQFLQMLLIFFYLICGLSMTFLVWTIYAHYVFDKHINDRVEGAIKDRGIHRMSKEEVERKRLENAERRRKANNTRFANPKKRTAQPKPQPENDITPLETTFSRRDLERLEEQKKLAAAAEQEAEADAADDATADTTVTD